MPKTNAPTFKQTLFATFWERMRVPAKKMGSTADPAVTWTEQTARQAFAPILVRPEPNGTAFRRPVITVASVRLLPTLLVINKAVNTFVTKIGFNAAQHARITPAPDVRIAQSMKSSIARTGQVTNRRPGYARLRTAQWDVLMSTGHGNASRVRQGQLTEI